MAKLLHKCLSLTLVVMLMASLCLGASFSASANDKTGAGLAEYAMTAYNEGWKYVWGGASYGEVDCSGLIYSYVGGGARVTEDMLYSSPESGEVSDGVPDIPGLGLWQPGHVGVYVGNGMAVDARDEVSNMCYSAVSSKSWVMWFKVAGISYEDTTDYTNVTNDDQYTKSTDTTNSSDNSEDSEQYDYYSDEEENTFEVLSIGAQGEEVNKLQKRLKVLGYFEDEPSYYFGYSTQTSLIEFQRAAGLSQSGELDRKTYDVLYSDNAPEKKISVKDSETDFADNTDTAKPKADTEKDTASDNSDTDTQLSERQYPDALYQIGDEDNEVGNIQYILAILGYYNSDITGKYEDDTAYAVARFQDDYHLDVTGYVNRATYTTLYKVYNGEYEGSDSNKSVLSLGDSGEKVKDLQRTLIVLGYLSYPEIEEFGYFGEETKAAVISAQKSFGLEPSGVADEDFKNAVKSSSENNDSSTDNVSDNDVSQAAAEVQPQDSDNTGGSTAQETSSVPTSSSTSAVAVPQTGIISENTETVILAVGIISLIVIFFIVNIHYWNVSMEKRKQRAKRANAVSVYQRRYK
ncbi:MAG: peptidoglycan-binding protein [Clostridia bacterium]|nr:peptidoglycan-binding protein [Clostridia bacterium]